MSFQLELYRNGETLFIRVKGRVVLDECERFKQACMPLVKQGVKKVAVEMSEVEFIDSAGLGVLVGMKMASNKAKAKMSIVSPSQGVADILYVSKLDGIFDVVTGSPAEVMRQENCDPDYRIDAPGADGGAASPPSSPASMAPAGGGGYAPQSAPLPPPSAFPLSGGTASAGAPPSFGPTPQRLSPAGPAGQPPQPLAPLAPPSVSAPGQRPMGAPPSGPIGAAPRPNPLAPPPLPPAGPRGVQPLAPGGGDFGGGLPPIQPYGGGGGVQPLSSAPPSMAPRPVAPPPSLNQHSAPSMAPRPVAPPPPIQPLGGRSGAMEGSRAPLNAPPRLDEARPRGQMPSLDDDLLGGVAPGVISPLLGPPSIQPLSPASGKSAGPARPPAPPAPEPEMDFGPPSGDPRSMAPAAPAAPKAAPASMDPMAFLGDLPLPEGDAPLLVGENPSDLSAFLPDDDLGVATGLSAGSASPSFPMDDRGAGRAALPPGPAAKPKSSVDEKSMKELVELHCGRAFEHMRKGAYEESIQEYRRALEYDPDYLPALNNLAIVYEKKPSWHAQAILHWEKVERLSATKGDPKHVERARKHLDNLRKMNEG